jgi:hypothetical protein
MRENIFLGSFRYNFALSSPFVVNVPRKPMIRSYLRDPRSGTFTLRNPVQSNQIGCEREKTSPANPNPKLILMRRLSSKELGEAVEARFLSVAVFLGLIVAKLWGDNRPFDFYVAAGENTRPNRVQVKGSRDKHHRGYRFNCMHTGEARPYTAKEIDVIAAYVVPTDTWYIVPVAAVKHLRGFKVYPDRPDCKGRFERYRDRWDLLLR